MASWKPEVIADNSGAWAGNALRFPTQAEAEAWALDLSYRWILVSQWRATESDDEPNYRWIDGRLVEIEAQPKESA